MPFDVIWDISCQAHSSLSLWQALSFASNLMVEYLELLPRKCNPLQRHQHLQLFAPHILSFLFQSHSHYPDENMEHQLYLLICQSPYHNLKTSQRRITGFYWLCHSYAHESDVGNGWRFHASIPLHLVSVLQKHSTLQACHTCSQKGVTSFWKCTSLVFFPPPSCGCFSHVYTAVPGTVLRIH